jgi:hypothetical protein
MSSFLPREFAASEENGRSGRETGPANVMSVRLVSALASLQACSRPSAQLRASVEASAHSRVEPGI